MTVLHLGSIYFVMLLIEYLVGLVLRTYRNNRWVYINKTMGHFIEKLVNM